MDIKDNRPIFRLSLCYFLRLKWIYAYVKNERSGVEADGDRNLNDRFERSRYRIS